MKCDQVFGFWERFHAMAARCSAIPGDRVVGDRKPLRGFLDSYRTALETAASWLLPGLNRSPFSGRAYDQRVRLIRLSAYVGSLVLEGVGRRGSIRGYCCGHQSKGSRGLEGLDGGRGPGWFFQSSLSRLQINADQRVYAASVSNGVSPGLKTARFPVG